MKETENKIIAFYDKREGINNYFDKVLEEQGWTVSAFDKGRDYIEKAMPDGSRFGFAVSRRRDMAVDDINAQYLEYVKNGLRTNIMSSVISGENLEDAAAETNSTLNALRRLRNAFKPHDTEIPEWLKDIVNFATAQGMETLCTKGKEGFTLLLFMPLFDYALEVQGNSMEEMYAALDYKADTFSEHRYFLQMIKDKPGSGDYEVIAKARMVKQSLHTFRDTVVNFLNGTPQYS